MSDVTDELKSSAETAVTVAGAAAQGALQAVMIAAVPVLLIGGVAWIGIQLVSIPGRLLG